jgi:hypothetical protein
MTFKKIGLPTKLVRLHFSRLFECRSQDASRGRFACLFLP